MTPAPRLARQAALLAATLALAACEGPPADAPTVDVFLPPGSTFDQITDSLVARGVVRDRRWFRLTARVARYDRKLKAGYYELRQGERTLAVLRALATGSEKTVRFTFPEGSTIIDLASLAHARLGLEPDSVLAAARDSSLIQGVGADAPSLEGYLYPETYFVSRMITARGLVQEMTKQFQRSWDSTWDRRRAAAGLSREQLLAMASIVEGEARVDEERPLIAAVYLNRLRLRMPLQADPTVQYAIQLSTGARKSRLFERDYRVPSPYNTYLHPGLPPGPVGAPSRASIEAVLAPADVPYLFFVAQPDGRHVFTRTYGQHLQAIARIRQVEREIRRQARADSAAAR